MKNDRERVQEHAVSPVVGVMLMLVVTIIIAAVVSAFSGGLSSGVKEAPQAAIDVKISTSGASMDGSEANIEFKLLSGNGIPTKDLAIITYYTNRTGHTYRHEQSASSAGTDLYGAGNYSSYGVYGGFDYSNATNIHHIARVPFLSDMRYGYAGGTLASGASEITANTVVDFGNFTWKSGDIMATNGNAGTADLLGINDSSDPHGFSNVADFEIGDIVDVKILHKPSGKYLFNKEIIVS
ncbi:MAG: type IV pilin N-terminal domain-containing protein [Methanoregula sp.]|nr:type IV pilin N-terminal domain-containing protein [Methanoregula sp.]